MNVEQLSPYQVAVAPAPLTAEQKLERLLLLVDKLLDRVSEYGNGCGCCQTLSVSQTDEYEDVTTFMKEVGVV